jgi:hypothetical protein
MGAAMPTAPSKLGAVLLGLGAVAVAGAAIYASKRW